MLLSNRFFPSLHKTSDDQENSKPGVFLLVKELMQGFKWECGAQEGGSRFKTPRVAGLARLSSSSCSFGVGCLELKHLAGSPPGDEAHSSQTSAGFKCWLCPRQAVTLSLLLYDRQKWHSWMTRHWEKGKGESSTCVSKTSWWDHFLLQWNTTSVQWHPPAADVSISSKDGFEFYAAELLLVLFWDVRPVFTHLVPRKTDSKGTAFQLRAPTQRHI